MPREIDEKKKRKALRKLRRAASLAEQGLGPPLSEWERQFLQEVEQRVETYGSAFRDIEKGGADEPLSALQTVKLREIDKKARGKAGTGFKTRKPLQGGKSGYKSRDVNEESGAQDAGALLRPPALALVRASDLPAAPRPSAPPKPKGRPDLRVVSGGRGET